LRHARCHSVLIVVGFVVDDTMYIEIMVDNSYEALHGLNISVQEMTRGYSNGGAK